MKKILSLLLSVSLVLTMIPVISFAAEDDQTAGDGNVIPMTSQEEIAGEESPGDPAAGEEPAAAAKDVNAAPEGETPGGSGDAEEPPAMEEQQQVLNDGGTRAGDTVEWSQDSYGYTCTINGSPVPARMLDVYNDSRYYFFANNIDPDNPTTAYLQVGQQKNSDGKYYYFNKEGNAPSEASTYGIRLSGWIDVDNKGLCYFGPDKRFGWQTIGGEKYFLDKTTGVKQTGWQRKTIDGNTYYFNANGELQTGWQKKTIDSNIYYFDPQKNGAMKTGFATIDNGKYLFNAAGALQTGWKTVGSNARPSYFNTSTGRMQTGWATISSKRYYLDPSNGMYSVGWRNIGGAKYFFDKKTGVMKTGWQRKTIDKKYYYYFYPSSGQMARGWATISKKTYFFKTSNGRMAKGWLKYKKKKYYLTPSGKRMGVMVKGFKKLNGTYYYFDKSNGAMKSNECVKTSKKLYYFFKNGKAQMKKGWFKGSDKKKRYSLGNGAVATGKKKIGSTWYYFSKINGTVTKKLGDDLDQKVQAKSSATRYLIAVKRSTYEVRVYTGSKGSWTKVKTFKCAIGMDATPTKTGTYTITSKGVMNKYPAPDGTQTRYWYWCYYTGTQGIHSGLYYDGGAKDGQDYDTRVGVKSTNGGIRVDYSNAKWIYNNVPVNTTVVVY